MLTHLYHDDSMLQNMADAYANSSDQNNPYVSPVYGNFSKGFPPTLIQGVPKKCSSVILFACIKPWIKLASLSNWIFMKACHMYFKQSFHNTTESNIAISKTNDFLMEYLKY